MLTSTLFAKSEFTTSFNYMSIEGQNDFDHKLYFLVNGQLISKTTKTSGSRLEIRWKLNGKAISKAELNEFLMPEQNTEVLYSANANELKQLMK